MELVATRMVMPNAGRLWPDWRLEMALGPWAHCGPIEIADETYFSPGLKHHAGPMARTAPAGTGDRTGATILIRNAVDYPGPGWRLLGWIGYVMPDGTPARAHIFGTNPRRLPEDVRETWRRCLRRLPPSPDALPPPPGTARAN